jgi:hypothetical protein
MQEALNNDWYVPGAGTMPDDLGKLLEAHGVKVTRTEHANIFNLVSELAQGHRVIISVDSGELWESNPVAQTVAGANAETWEDWRPDHVVIVSGVDISDPNNPLVIVTDPGTGEVAATYSLPDFLEAWEDSGFSMVATADAPPSFDAEHVANIGALAYADFERWYPSVAELNGHEPGFAGLCAGFDGLMREPAPIQPPDADWMSTIEHDLGHDLGHDLHHDMGLNTVDQPDSPDSDGDDGSGD